MVRASDQFAVRGSLLPQLQTLPLPCCSTATAAGCGQGGSSRSAASEQVSVSTSFLVSFAIWSSSAEQSSLLSASAGVQELPPAVQSSPPDSRALQQALGWSNLTELSWLGPVEEAAGGEGSLVLWMAISWELFSMQPAVQQRLGECTACRKQTSAVWGAATGTGWALAAK